MADTTKPVEVPKEEAPATITDAVAATETPAQPEIKTEETAPAATEATKDVTEAPAAETTTEEAPKEVVPIEQGQLEHKGSNFPKNFIYSKKYFWFGSDAVDVKKIPALAKDHHLAAWAAETGKGLLFVNEKGNDTTTPTSAIHLADAVEPTTEGQNKFFLTSKGHKHTFKAANAADRDNWVAQIKARITEAKELSKTIVESETYKTTLASFTPAVAKKEEKAEEKKAEETPKAVEETSATTEAPVAAATTEAPKEEAKEEAAKEEAAKDVKPEETKKASASKKRASIFGSLLGGGKKAEEKKEEKIDEATPAEETAATTETPATTTTEAAVVPETTTEAADQPEAVATEAVAETPESPAKAADKPTPSKRASIFSGLSFGKKPKAEEAAPATPAKDTEVSETAPVIPKPDATEPLSAEVSSPANVPVETATTEAAVAPVVNGDKKPEMKSEKRKSSFPFQFGKKSEEIKDGEVSTSPDAKTKENPFSKLRATIKGKGKAADKSEEKPTEAEKIDEEAAATEAKADDTKPVEEAPAVAATEEASEPAKDTPVASAPVVTASA